MPLAVEIVAIVLGILLLAAARSDSGTSRRLPTVPETHRTPRVVLAVPGAVLVAGGMWGLVTEKAQHGPSRADLQKHIPNDISSALNCKQATESPKGAVEVECDSKGSSSAPNYPGDPSVTVGDQACLMDGSLAAASSTDRRFNMIVWARDPIQRYSDVTPATPSQKPAGS
ncbi:hypothetical protein AV521_14285 [Streptomyces sp. IMTB 2501]|uniref:hypothetical protein n=1 Tax=Streptomyces sp. IMTB 2501 TaxID=1776340 RepID=UPI00096EA8B7|nr:hypothetical protein [Streptomyces sp. IMTB 2501]OLZ70314.1 hypothetical protein AV521_14285 [Streptomyces sp. IMTB 2501]